MKPCRVLPVFLALLALGSAPAAATDWSAAFDDCALQSKVAQKINECRRKVMLHSRIDEAFAAGEDGVVLRLDANDANDSAVEADAKARYHKALDACGAVSKQAQRIAACRRDALGDYHRALGR